MSALEPDALLQRWEAIGHALVDDPDIEGEGLVEATADALESTLDQIDALTRALVKAHGELELLRPRLRRAQDQAAKLEARQRLLSPDEHTAPFPHVLPAIRAWATAMNGATCHGRWIDETRTAHDGTRPDLYAGTR